MMQTQPLIAADSESKSIDRDYSWLSFNERVLANAHNVKVPLGERLRFATISAENLDEFYMVRLAGLYQLQARDYKRLPDSDIRLDDVIGATEARATALKDAQQNVILSLLEDLKQTGFHLISDDMLTDSDSEWLEAWYQENYLPLLAPTTLDPSHPFPFIQNRGKGLLVDMVTKKGSPVRAVILLPENADRFVRLPGTPSRFLPIEQAILKFIPMIYPKHDVLQAGMFRVLRDSEIEIDDEAEDLISEFESALRARRRGNVISLVLSGDFSPSARQLFKSKMQVAENQIFVSRAFVGVGDFKQLLSELPKTLFYHPFNPRFPQRILDYKGDCFAAIHNKDILVHHPYESFDVVIRFLQQAAEDPDVLSIRQTLYRTTPSSPIVKALISAAEAGKSVTAVIELKARFDEANNIELARLLERAGVLVVYGLSELKVHSKLSLVIRRENQKLVSYAHVGTGNYHPITARIYTDLSYFTCDKDICDDVRQIFNYLTSHVKPKKLRELIISPKDSFDWFASMVDQEIAFAKAGKPASIWVKCNALVDNQIIEKLYEASAAGVQIELLVRGICCLRPAVAGLSETIRVRSLIGRFLEHGRIFVFGNGSPFLHKDNLVFMGSADLMPRNLFRRVEAIVPIRNATVREQVLNQIMNALFRDTDNCWFMAPDGSYSTVDSAPSFSSHEYFMENPSLSGLGSLAKTKAKLAGPKNAPVDASKR